MKREISTERLEEQKINKKKSLDSLGQIFPNAFKSLGIMI